MANKLAGSSFLIQVTNLEISSRPHAWHPPTDLFETEKEYTIRLEVAGMKNDDFTIQYGKNILSISGRRPLLSARCAYHRMEISSGEFQSSVQLPENINVDQATAEYSQGFLTIKIPKAIPFNIEINSKKAG